MAAIGAQVSVLQRSHRIGPSDLLTSLAPLTDTYPLTVTLAALFSNASLALTPVCGPKVPYSSAFQGASPTIVIAGSRTLSEYYMEKIRVLLTQKVGFRHWWKSRSLEAGVMPKASPTANSPRLIYTYDNASPSTTPLSPSELLNLRIFTGARIIYAFTDSHVAGAVSQTHMLDYRNLESTQGQHSHFGPPLSCLEIKFKDSEGHKNGDNIAVGQLVISGPAVVGEEAVADQIMAMTEENTLIYP